MRGGLSSGGHYNAKFNNRSIWMWS